MRDSGGGTLPKAEGVSTDKVRAFTVGVIQGVEEKRGGRAEEVLDVLLKSIDVFARWVLGHLFPKRTNKFQFKQTHETLIGRIQQLTPT